MTRDLRAAILAEAEGWIGTPYRHQGARKGVGADCLGLVLGVWRAVLGTAPELPGPYAPDWAEAGAGDPMLDAARRHCRELSPDAAAPGDLLLFRWRPDLPCRHAGICARDGRFIHAYAGASVVSSALVPGWRRRIAATFLFPHKDL